uniref:Calcium uniporter protein, mitochondrial n=2 Tax=Bactrocera latifrons TaxID=174628 RepID=A0A0K8VE55_BACLA
MAPGVCVTSFRMLLRRTELSSHLSRGLRLTPTAPYLLNSWSTRRYCKQSNDTSKDEQQQRTGKSETANENAEPSAKESNLLAKSMQTQNFKPHHLLKADETLSKEGDITTLKISQLRTQLRAHGLSPVGKKDVLVQRLQSYLRLKAGKPTTHISTDTQAYELVATADEEKIINSESATEHSDTDHQLAKEQASEEQLEITPLMYQNRSSNQATTKHEIDNVELHAKDPNYEVQHSTVSSASSTQSPKECGTGNASGGENDGDDDDSHHSNKTHSTENVGAHNKGDVYVEYIQGLPHLTVPLPSRLEKCRFALRPVSHKVGDLIEMLKIEDHGIDRAVVLNKCGVRIASTCAIDSLMDEPFWLQINDNKYEVIPPKRKKIDSEDLKRLSDVRTLVAQLYEALHVGEYHLHKEHELVKKIENLKFEIAPLEMEKQELAKLAQRKTVVATWVGLSLMAVQFGVLARLTWWEYSWDIMEPVTYFVTYGTTMALYAYYCLTKSEYTYETVRNRLFLITMHKKAKRKSFDIEKYNQLRREIAEAEYDLRRLRDPINLQLPPHIDRSQRSIPVEPPTSGDGETRLLTAVTSEKKPASFRLPFLEPKN